MDKVKDLRALICLMEKMVEIKVKKMSIMSIQAKCLMLIVITKNFKKYQKKKN